MTTTALRTLSLGKLRALQQLSTPNGALSILALDQRGNLRQLLRPDQPAAVTGEALTAFKTEVISILAPASSGVLLDPEYGAAQCLVSGALPGATGLIIAVEATGYSGDASARHSQILPGWDIAKAKRMGASAVKLLVYYHPDSPTAPEIEQLIQQVAASCSAHEIPLFLEPLSYSLDSAQLKLSAVEKRCVVIETAHRLSGLGADVLKSEFPADPNNEREWESACIELSSASAIPWIVLSGGVHYDVYLRQVITACRAGASGVAVGRAVWKEAAALHGLQRSEFLHETAHFRMTELTALCNSFARTWTATYTAPQIEEGWYVHY
jgi:tagatose 1,6-diphosphate aldolase